MHRHGTRGTPTSVSHASTTPGPDLFLDGAPQSSQSPPGSQSSQPGSQPGPDIIVEGFNYHAILPTEDSQIQALYQAAAEEEPRSPHPLEADYTSPCHCYTNDVRGAFFVARQRTTGSVVGVCGLRAAAFSVAPRRRVETPSAANVAELRRLFVHPDWRGRGVGRQLLQAAIHEANRLAYGQVLAVVPAAQQAALSLLGKVGFATRAVNDGFVSLDLNAL